MQDQIDTKAKERAEFHALIAGFLSNVNMHCIECHKDLHIDYVENQISKFPREQLLKLQSSEEPIGVFCCNCHPDKKHEATSLHSIYDESPWLIITPLIGFGVLIGLAVVMAFYVIPEINNAVPPLASNTTYTEISLATSIRTLFNNPFATLLIFLLPLPLIWILQFYRFAA